MCVNNILKEEVWYYLISIPCRPSVYKDQHDQGHDKLMKVFARETSSRLLASATQNYVGISIMGVMQ